MGVPPATLWVAPGDGRQGNTQTFYFVSSSDALGRAFDEASLAASERASHRGQDSCPMIAFRNAMQTFTAWRPFVSDSSYMARRRDELAGLERLLSSGAIDTPFMPLVKSIREIPYCYTLQSCFGHFVLSDGTERYRIKDMCDRLDEDTIIRFKIPYIAFCVENSESGRSFVDDLKAVQRIDSEYIQFGCADWFWNYCVNSYVLQVEPERYAYEDSCEVTLEEAVHLESTRDKFYKAVDRLVVNRLRCVR